MNLILRFLKPHWKLCVVTILLLILLVCLIQGVFNRIARHADKRSR